MSECLLPEAVVAAVRKGDAESVRRSVEESHALLQARTASSRETLLHLAAGFGHRPLVDYLLARGADVNARAHYGDSPLDLAILGGHNDVAELLRAHGGREGVAGELG